jgi:hypothetical protein
MIAAIISFIDKEMPGQKRYEILLVGIGIMVCQMMGYQQFPEEAWGLLGIGGAATWKMGQDRKKK